MSARALWWWRWLHRWSSLVCTLFLFLLCLTGLPLIFSDEIGALTQPPSSQVTVATGPRASLDRIEVAARAAHPDLVPLYFFAEEDAPDRWFVKLDTRPDTDERSAVLLTVDAHTGALIDEAEFGAGFMDLMYRLHVDLFAGLPGKLFLGVMGVLFLISLISGTVLYAPFMRRLDFATVRQERPARIRWLDRHNLLGIATLAWAFVVGGTGAVNTLADLVLRSWREEQIQKLAADQTTILLKGDRRLALTQGRIQRVLDRASQAAPDMHPSIVAYPGTLLATPEHFAVILRGDTPLTSRLSQSLLIHPDSGEVVQAAARPWYVTLLQLSQPLHFGDYGGWPLKLLWAVLDLITLVVLGSGLYLWWPGRSHRHRATNETRGTAQHV